MLLIFASFLSQVLLAPPSSAHRQPKLMSIEHIVHIPTFLQSQGSSNLCGLCALNNATTEVVFTAKQMDAVADRLWITAALDPAVGITAPLLPTRFRDGSLQQINNTIDGKLKPFHRLFLLLLLLFFLVVLRVRN